MNASQFIASITGRSDALEQLDGAIWGEKVDPRLSEDDRQLLVSEQLRLMKGTKHARRKKG